MESM
jgi:hypothetical protein